MLEINGKTGCVTAARMEKSTGHAVLDNATLSALRQWRMKPGSKVRLIRVPVNYTYQGGGY